jgi:transcriptional regulator with XRE-family HTH domain
MTLIKNSDKTSKEIVGLTIEKNRRKKNISQQELADLLEVDRQYIWRLENGKVNLTMNYLDKIIKQLDCLQSDFLVVIQIESK